MLFYLRGIVMRILSKRQVKELVLYSPQHIARLEKAGSFPLRV
jgi:prophage regulatory protein